MPVAMMKLMWPCSSSSGEGRPRDAAQAAVAVQPLVLKRGGEAVGAEALKVLDGGGDVRVRDELVPEIAANERGEVVSGGGLAGAVEADDAAGGVEDGDESVDGCRGRWRRSCARR